MRAELLTCWEPLPSEITSDCYGVTHQGSTSNSLFLEQCAVLSLGSKEGIYPRDHAMCINKGRTELKEKSTHLIRKPSIK